MANKLVIHKEGATIGLKLYVAESLVGEVDFPLDIHFDTMLVSAIDRILKENRIDRVSPLETVLEGFDDESSMSSLIAQTIIEALKIK
jgi:hypothetical protein